MFSAQDRRKCQLLFEKYYAGRKFYDALYSETILRHLQPGQRLLDAGCGRYLKFSKALSGKARVVGIDLEDVLDTHNQNAPYGVRGDLNYLPFPANYFDMVISRSVVEHLEDPPKAFREFARVLRPGGKVVIITPNKYDYVSVIAALTPYKLHRSLVSRIFQVSEDDVFPTLYRANTLSSFARAMRSAGFAECELDTVNHYPAYLMFSPILFRLGVLYERLTSLRLLRALRGSILAVFVKSGLPQPTAPHTNRQTDVQSETPVAGGA
jgi:ubiquinone/menaquinone biosynthesis C-methylase UbiE